MIKNKTIIAEEMGYVSPRAKVVTLTMTQSVLQSSLTEGSGEPGDPFTPVGGDDEDDF